MSGVPNRASAGALPSLCSWNGRGIFCGSRPEDRLRARKLLHVQKCVKSADISGFQETHASHASTYNFIHSYACSHWVGWSTNCSEHTNDNIVNFSIDQDSTFGVSASAASHQEQLNVSTMGSSSGQKSNFVISSHPRGLAEKTREPTYSNHRPLDDSHSDSSSCSGSEGSHESLSSTDCSATSELTASSESLLSSGDTPTKGGGVMTFVRRAAFGSTAVCNFNMLVSGRCLETHITDNDQHFYHINIHFFGLTPLQIKNISNRIEHLQELAKHDPMRIAVFVAGDLNLRFADKPILHARSAVESFKEPKYAKGAKVFFALSSLFYAH